MSFSLGGGVAVDEIADGLQAVPLLVVEEQDADGAKSKDRTGVGLKDFIFARHLALPVGAGDTDISGVMILDTPRNFAHSILLNGKTPWFHSEYHGVLRRFSAG